MRSSVDLPTPLGPTMPRRLRGPTAALTSSSTTAAPWLLATPRAATVPVGDGASGREGRAGTSETPLAREGGRGPEVTRSAQHEPSVPTFSDRVVRFAPTSPRAR